MSGGSFFLARDRAGAFFGSGSGSAGGGGGAGGSASGAISEFRRGVETLPLKKLIFLPKLTRLAIIYHQFCGLQVLPLGAVTFNFQIPSAPWSGYRQPYIKTIRFSSRGRPLIVLLMSKIWGSSVFAPPNG